MSDNGYRSRMGVPFSAVRDWRGRLVLPVELTPIRIALAYAVLGLFGLFVSDVLFVRYLSEPLLGRVQTLKGGVEVVLTAALVFVLTDRRERQLQRGMDRLDQQREELQVLHRVLRHNLRNDLNVIRGYVTRVHEQLPADSSQCQRVLDTAERMIHYTEQAARIRRVTDKESRTIDLADVIPAVLEDHPRITDGVEVSTTLPDRALVEANPMLREALGELVTNAVVHNDGDAPAVSVEVRTDGGLSGFAEVRIADNGPGIPPSELEALRAGEDGQILHLSGMGLWFVKWTVRHSGGEFHVESDEEGTTACLRLPKASGALPVSRSPGR